MYDYKQVREAIQAVKDYNITTTKKNQHQAQLYEVKNLYYDLMEINRYLFDPEMEYNWRNYKTGVELNKTKKELDKLLQLCILYLGNQLTYILRMQYN